MPNNYKGLSTTRSISWKCDTLSAVDGRVGAIRSDRSSFVNDVMEHILGILPHPDVVGADIPFVPADEQARRTRFAALMGRTEEERALIRRPTISDLIQQGRSA